MKNEFAIANLGIRDVFLSHNAFEHLQTQLAIVYE
jgi:hypothetical protein